MRVVGLASGSGYVLGQMMETFRNDPRIQIVGVVADAPDIGAVANARQFDIPTIVVRRNGKANLAAFNEQIAVAVDSLGGNFIVCFFNHLLTAPVLNRWPNRIINMHYALLPAFVGFNPIPFALSHGVKIAGATLHFVDETKDGGPIIAQTAIPISPSDSSEMVQNRLIGLSCPMALQVMDWFADDRVNLNLATRKVEIYNADYSTLPTCPAIERFRDWRPIPLESFGKQSPENENT